MNQVLVYKFKNESYYWMSEYLFGDGLNEVLFKNACFFSSKYHDITVSDNTLTPLYKK